MVNVVIIGWGESGEMTRTERECRDAWALADPETVVWTASRYVRQPMPEDERDPSPPDEDDDTVGADWDEMGHWDLDGEEDDEDED